jgi:aspartate kinase
MEDEKIGGIMQSDGRALIKVMSVPDHASVAGTVFTAIAENGVNIELLVESFDIDECGNFAIVIDGKDLDRVMGLLEDLKSSIDAKIISYIPDVAVITVFAPHLREKPRIHGRMFSSIASMGVSSLAISTSLSSVSCVVEGPSLDIAIRSLSEIFDLPYGVKDRPKDY